MDLFSEVEEAMDGVAPVDQSPQERPKGPSTDSSSTLPYSYNVSNPSSPSSSPVVSTLNSPSGVPSITIPPDIPIKVEYLPDPIPVPSPPFHFPGYSTSTSILGSSSISTLYTPHVTDSPVLVNPSGQEVSHSVPPFKSTPIIGSLSVPSQSLANPYSSSSFSFDMLLPLSSSVTYDQNLPSCSFATPKIISPFTSTSPVPSSILPSRKPRGRQPAREGPLEGTLLGENFLEVKGGVVLPSLGTLLTLVLVPTTFLFPILHPCLPRDICLGMWHWICLLDLGSAVTSPRIPQLTPSSLTTPVLPKSFLP